jgi:hypothetical protein
LAQYQISGNSEIIKVEQSSGEERPPPAGIHFYTPPNEEEEWICTLHSMVYCTVKKKYWPIYSSSIKDLEADSGFVALS